MALNPLVETYLMVATTVVTNAGMIPTIVACWRRGCIHESIVTFFTCLTSTMYHLCDSLGHPMWLTEGEWHRLDNVFAIMALVILVTHLMGNTKETNEKLRWTWLGIVLMLQQKNPWDVWNTVLPILANLIHLAVAFLAKWQPIPNYDRKKMKISLVGLLFGLVFFSRGLDDQTDFLRLNHGIWHMLMGLSSWGLFTCVPHSHATHKAEHVV